LNNSQEVYPEDLNKTLLKFDVVPFPPLNILNLTSIKTNDIGLTHAYSPLSKAEIMRLLCLSLAALIRIYSRQENKRYKKPFQDFFTLGREILTAKNVEVFI